MKRQRCRELHCGECVSENASRHTEKCIAPCKKVHRDLGCHRSESPRSVSESRRDDRYLKEGEKGRPPVPSINHKSSQVDRALNHPFCGRICNKKEKRPNIFVFRTSICEQSKITISESSSFFLKYNDHCGNRA
ncbi:hypothetical protein OUZ56_005485 [Daphnia magna]|uniref:Uncharacterized protein n=1 Tax=Daphnia magna TaxID=35525 RepID=A0ABQ9YTE7_9CRUS|nr:hypothetical protein OUZ56_005485 [Daphnia magna]